MIKALMEDQLLLGLSEENVKRLKEGKFVSIDLKTLGSPQFTKIGIFYGKTEEAMIEEFKPFIGPHTRIHGQEN